MALLGARRELACKRTGSIINLAPGSLRLVVLLPAVVVLLLLATTRHSLAQSSQQMVEHEEEELQIAPNGLPDLWGTRRRHDPKGATEVPAHRSQSNSNRTTRKRENEPLDPFVFTFEDYLREAGGSGGAGSGSAPLTATTSGNQLARPADESDNLIGSELEPARSAGLIVEDEDSAVSSSLGSEAAQRSNNKIRQDYDYAAARQVGAPESGGGGGEQATRTTPQQGNRDAELRLLFGWRSLPTNKCSRECGRGARINHLSCVDLKYNVRVEDELCLGAQLAKPSELSDEPCNETDCPPQWNTIEFQQCTPTADQTAECRPKLFKRLECTMLNRHGQLVHLDESHCQADERRTPATDANFKQSSSERPAAAASWPSSADHEDLSIDLNEQLDKERNEILLSNELAGDGDGHHSHRAHSRHHNYQLEHAARRHHQLTTLNEPFFEPTHWSPCSGAPCGQLGKRTRRLVCRMFLSRSAKLVELPESSCATGNAGHELHREEPCYMDCAASSSYGADEHQDEELTIETLASGRQRHEYKLAAGTRDDDDDDERQKELDEDEETILDADATRHVWRHATDWTKCSAECLGGLSESLVECWDRVANVSVDVSQCESAAHLRRPAPLTRPCNEIPCAPEWRLGPFTQCSRPCGSAGTRSRPLACVQQVPPRLAHGSNYMLVSNDLCLSVQQANASSSSPDGAKSGPVAPHHSEPCNRHHCRPEWSLGPWGECNTFGQQGANGNGNGIGIGKCAPSGQRNRSVICLQEFASQWGPLDETSGASNGSNNSVLADLREAIQLAAPTWRPGQAIQVPFSECYREYRSVPQLSETCATNCPDEFYIDAEPSQDYRMLLPDGSLNTGYQMKRRTLTLKVGGRAQLLEGRHVKIRCRILSKNKQPLVSGTNENGSNHQRHQQVEWRKDGVRIFAPNTTMADKRLLDETDNSILGNGQADDLLDNELSINLDADRQYNNLMAADEPEASRLERLERLGSMRGAKEEPKTRAPRARKLSVRSWPSGADSANFQFVVQPGGRFTLVKENTLRIKRLKLHDSGVYTCSSGPQLSESIELSVLSKRARNLLEGGPTRPRLRAPSSSHSPLAPQQQQQQQQQPAPQPDGPKSASSHLAIH